MLLQFVLVVARYLLRLGSIWLTETVLYAPCGGVHAGGGMDIADRRPCAGRHFLRASASARTKALIDLVGSAAAAVAVRARAVLLSVPYAARSWAILEHSQEASGLPLVFVLKTLIPLFAVLMALQGVAQAIRAAVALSRAR